MRHRLFHPLPFLIVLAACGGETTYTSDPPGQPPTDTGSTSTPDTPGDTGEIDDGLQITAGDWLTTAEYMETDDCNMGEWVVDGPGGELIVDVTSDDTFELTHSRGTEHCTLSGHTFSCDVWYSEDTTPQDEYGLDALITLELVSHGWFDSNDSLVMETDVEADCDGGSCWLVSLTTSSFPCDMLVHLEASPK